MKHCAALHVYVLLRTLPAIFSLRMGNARPPKLLPPPVHATCTQHSTPAANISLCLANAYAQPACTTFARTCCASAVIDVPAANINSNCKPAPWLLGRCWVSMVLIHYYYIVIQAVDSENICCKTLHTHHQVWFLPNLCQLQQCLLTNDGLVQQHMVQH